MTTTDKKEVTKSKCLDTFFLDKKRIIYCKLELLMNQSKFNIKNRRICEILPQKINN